MKCPKCGYIGFEQTERCRNCGYDFVLADGAPPAPDLPLRGGEPEPLADFDLGAAGRPAGDGAARRRDPDLHPRITPPARPSAADLPLFGEDDLPIVPAASPTPVAVRRSTLPAARSRPRPTPRFAELPSAPLPLSGDSGGPADAPWGASPAGTPAVPAGTPSPVGARVAAGLLDLVLLLGADLVVVYFTLKICRLAPSEILTLPLTPLLAFLVLFNGGYLVLLTASGGQTLGKMAFGLKVIGRDDCPVTVGRSLVRVLALVAGAAPAGLGLLPVVLTADNRGVHDRLADTRVVRVEAG